MRRNRQLIEAYHTAEDLKDQTALPARCAKAASQSWEELRTQGELSSLNFDNHDALEELLADIYAFFCRANNISPLAVLPGAIPYLGEEY